MQSNRFVFYWAVLWLHCYACSLLLIRSNCWCGYAGLFIESSRSIQAQAASETLFCSNEESKYESLSAPLLLEVFPSDNPFLFFHLERDSVSSSQSAKECRISNSSAQPNKLDVCLCVCLPRASSGPFCLTPGSSLVCVC